MMPENAIDWIETNGACLVTSHGDFRQKIEQGRPLRVKYGIDPTGTEIHLGHTVPLRKLRQFQDHGHKAVLIIGTATAQVGDPSGRNESRPVLSAEQAKANAENFLDQIRKVIDVDACEIRYNSEWFQSPDFNLASLLSMMSVVTVQQLLHREDFSNRHRDSTPIGLHEFFYPLMQAHDSVVVEADVEIGGKEQLFNMMLGRKLQEKSGKSPQHVITMPILRGTDGVKKMGKSLDNFIGIRFDAFEMYSKVMSIPDELMTEWFTLLTDFDGDPEGMLRSNPRDAKMTLARQIVENYHGMKEGMNAFSQWMKFIKREDPDNMREYYIHDGTFPNNIVLLSKLMCHCNLTSSNSEARRLMEGNGVTVGTNKQRVNDVNAQVSISDGLIIRVGARKMVKIRLLPPSTSDAPEPNPF